MVFERTFRCVGFGSRRSTQVAHPKETTLNALSHDLLLELEWDMVKGTHTQTLYTYSQLSTEVVILQYGIRGPLWYSQYCTDRVGTACLCRSVSSSRSQRQDQPEHRIHHQVRRYPARRTPYRWDQTPSCLGCSRIRCVRISNRFCNSGRTCYNYLGSFE